MKRLSDHEKADRYAKAHTLKDETLRDDVIKIDRGVPLPGKTRKKRGSKYPFPLMKIGDSIAVACNPSGSLTRAMRITGWKFTRRPEGKGFRIWRIE